MLNVIITIGGAGTRMKAISPKDKHLLYHKDKRIIEALMDAYPEAVLVGHNKTESRMQTLMDVRHLTNTLIIDCDIIPTRVSFDDSFDTIFYFSSHKKKYGSLVIENGIVKAASETNNLSPCKCSGMYYVKSVAELLAKMTNPNSIASGMIGAHAIKESSFIRLGDVEDYFEAL